MAERKRVLEDCKFGANSTQTFTESTVHAVCCMHTCRQFDKHTNSKKTWMLLSKSLKIKREKELK